MLWWKLDFVVTRLMNTAVNSCVTSRQLKIFLKHIRQTWCILMLYMNALPHCDEVFLYLLISCKILDINCCISSLFFCKAVYKIWTGFHYCSNVSTHKEPLDINEIHASLNCIKDCCSVWSDVVRKLCDVDVIHFSFDHDLFGYLW